MIQLVRAIILVVGLVGATVSATPTKKCVYSDYRLPKHIVPKHYNLEFEVGTGESHYTGKVHIQLAASRNVVEHLPRSLIVLNVHPDVEIFDVMYNDGGLILGYNKVRAICRDDENELLVIHLGGNLIDIALGELVMSFSGKYRDDKTGIFKTEYKTQAGVISYQISTDFKPNKARRAFPCFDEPSFKATFEITLTHDPWMIALSNTPISSVGAKRGRIETKFTKTPRMSTYLVAFTTGQFEQIQTATSHRRPMIRAFTRMGKSQHARFALETAKAAIIRLESYFNIAFPLEKLDLVSVVQHSADATENWGLIIVNETSFLFDANNMSPISMGDIAKTIIEAVTKQWFGNLVTLEWWDDLWLQEGFAGWMANFLIEQLYPKLEWEKTYLIETQQTALKKDSGYVLDPIRVAINRANINNILKDFHLVKSATVIGMLRDDYVGPNHFQNGIRLYLDRNMLGNVDAVELWKTLTFLSDKPVDKFIKSWVELAGHPKVYAELSSDSRRLILQQKREWPKIGITRREPSRQVRIIPVTILLSDGWQQLVPLTYIMDQPTLEVNFPDWFHIKDDKNHWLKVNAYSRGFYRAHHSMSIVFQRLQNPCKEMKLNSNDRIGLIDDLESSVKTGLLKSEKLFDYLGWFGSEMDGSVLARIARVFSNFRQCGRLCIPNFRLAYTRTRLSSQLFESAGTRRGLGIADAFGLVTVYSILLEMNYLPLVEEALTLFEEKVDHVAPIIRELVYKAVALYGTDVQRIRLQSFLLLGGDCEEEVNRINAALELLPERQAFTASSSQGIRERPEVLPERMKRQRIA